MATTTASVGRRADGTEPCRPTTVLQPGQELWPGVEGPLTVTQLGSDPNRQTTPPHANSSEGFGKNGIIWSFDIQRGREAGLVPHSLVPQGIALRVLIPRRHSGPLQQIQSARRPLGFSGNAVQCATISRSVGPPWGVRHGHGRGGSCTVKWVLAGCAWSVVGLEWRGCVRRIQSSKSDFKHNQCHTIARWPENYRTTKQAELQDHSSAICSHCQIIRDQPNPSS